MDNTQQSHNQNRLVLKWPEPRTMLQEFRTHLWLALSLTTLQLPAGFEQVTHVEALNCGLWKSTCHGAGLSPSLAPTTTHETMMRVPFECASWANGENMMIGSL